MRAENTGNDKLVLSPSIDSGVGVFKNELFIKSLSESLNVLGK